MADTRQARSTRRGGADRKRMTARRVRRRALRVLLLLTVAAVVGWFALSHTGIARRLVVGELRDLGVPVRVGTVTLGADLRVILDDVVVPLQPRERPADGAGERDEVGPAPVVRADQVEIIPDFTDLLSGEFTISRVIVRGPLVRVGFWADTGALNIRLPSGRPVERLPEVEIPVVVLENAKLDIWELGRDHAELPHASVIDAQASGLVMPSLDRPGEASIDLDAAAEGERFAVTGRIGDGGLVLRTRGLRFTVDQSTAAPEIVREPWDRLELRGAVEPSSIAIDASGDFSLRLALGDVSLRLPFDTDGDPGTETPRLQDVAGELIVTSDGISGSLDGRADTLRYVVDFDVWRSAAGNALRGRIWAPAFRLERDLRLLDAVPSVITEKLDLFLDPTADVSATVWLRQGRRPEDAPAIVTGRLPAPARFAETPAPPDGTLDVQGKLEFRNGVAAYKNFPVTFTGVTGLFAFDRTSITISRIQGHGPGGAELSARGSVAPLGPSAAVRLEIGVRGVPLADEVRAALTDGQEAIVDALFSAEELDRLVDRGLVITPQRAAAIDRRLEKLGEERAVWLGRPDAPADRSREIEAEVAELRSERERPAFRVGADMDVAISLNRAQQLESLWSRDVRVEMRRAGLLSAFFPLPLRSDLAVLTITNGDARIRRAPFRTLSGLPDPGRVQLEASADLNEPEAGGTARAPTVRIDAEDIPIDRLLLHAIPGPTDDEPGGPTNLSAVLDALRLTGALDAEADIEPDPADPARPTYRIEVGFDRVSAAPAPPAPPSGDAALTGTALEVRDLAGAIFVDPELIVADAEGRMSAGDQPVGDLDLLLQLALPRGERWGEQDPAALSAQQSPHLFARVTGRRLDLAAPVESAVALISPPVAERIVALRERWSPAGVLDLQASVDGPVDLAAEGADRRALPPVLSVTAQNFRDTRFDLYDRRAALNNSMGRLELVAGSRPALRATGFSADLTADEQPLGRLHLDGQLVLAPPSRWPILGAWAGPPLHASIAEARFESPLVRDLARQAVGALAEDASRRYDPRGLFDAEFTIRRAVGPSGVDTDKDPPAATAIPPLDVTAAIRPRSLTLAGRNGDVAFTQIEGRVVYSDAGGALESLRATGPAWTLALDGEWSQLPDGSLRLSVEPDLEADGLPQDLLGLLPEPVAETLDGLGLRAEGRVRFRDAALTLSVPPIDPDAATAPDPDELLLTATLDADQLAVTAGVEISELTGSAALWVWRLPDPATPEAPDAGFRLDAHADSLRLAGIRGANARALVIGDREGRVHLPTLSANVHGGRLGASAVVDPPSPGDPGAGRAYHLNAKITAAQLGPVLDDLAAREPASPDEPVSAASDGAFPATIDGDLSLTGVTNDPDELRGRGRIDIAGGAVLRLPLLSQLIEFSNLQLPTGERYGLARAGFYLDGRRSRPEGPDLIFEDITVVSPNVELFGFGSVTLPDGRLDLRFNSRPRNPIPLLSGILTGLRDELITTKVEGTLADPGFGVEQFSKTRRALADLFGLEPDPAVGRLAEIERQARALRRRAQAELQPVDSSAPRDDTSPLAPDQQQPPRPRPGGEHEPAPGG